jgi:hypothetical protein
MKRLNMGDLRRFFTITYFETTNLLARGRRINGGTKPLSFLEKGETDGVSGQTWRSLASFAVQARLSGSRREKTDRKVCADIVDTNTEEERANREEEEC